MGLFKKKAPLEKIFADFDRADCEDILETAKALSGSDRRVAAAVDAALEDPKGYINRSAKRFEERGIALDGSLDADELMLFAMLNELETLEYVFEFSGKCELEDFLWGLTQIKTYDRIKDVVRTLELDENGDVEAWGKEINKALDAEFYLCYIYIDDGSYPIAIVTPEEFERVPLPFVMIM
ncbi:MAG: hypothetical protein HDT43_07010 [Ruminococcaceae bacterium]|nr:hypothetical protein [Oscillospiraceae bacterium]